MVKYNACNFFMIRTPLLSVDDYLHMFDDTLQLNMRLGETFDEPLLREVIAVASKDLFEAIDKNDLSADSKSSEQVRSSLIKYFIRLSTRPTPFGLFSGISIGRFGDKSNITVSSPQCHTKRARPDMEWVYGFIKKIESNKNIRNNLRVRFNDFTYASGNRIEKPNKTFLQHDESNEDMQELSTSIRYTDQVKMIEQKCVEHQLFSSLLDEMTAQNPNVPVNRIEAFLSQLLENEFILSELRPPLTNTDMLNYLINILRKIENVEGVGFYVLKLEEIQKSIADYNATRVGEGLNIYNDIIRLQKKIYECKNYLQVDMKTHVESNILDHGLKEELEKFASTMCRLALPGKMNDELAYYTELFIEKYGYSSEVHLLELLDVDKGLGTPAHYQVNTINRVVPKRQKPIKEQRLDALLDRKLLLALREGKNSIEITDNDIDYVCGDKALSNDIRPMDYLQSFELYLLAHPGVLKNANEADYYFTIAPMPMSDGFGKSFGRFSDMLTEEESMLLKEGFEKQKELLSEYIIAEIAELPPRGRTSNISINNSGYDYQIALTTNACEGKYLLSVRDLYIGVERESNHFYIKSKSLNKKVVVAMTCMMNPTFGSNVLRFLREISTVRRIKIMNGIYNMLNLKYEYSPRITYGKIIIKPETWAISRDIFEMKNDKGKDKIIFDNKFNFYRQKWGIPRFVFLNETDNRLLLDLDNPAHRNEIYNTLKRNIPVVATLTELGCGFDDYASVSTDGKNYVTEIVLPFFLTPDSVKDNKKTTASSNDEILKTLSNISINRMQIGRDKLMLLPGNGKWLYFKLYGCSKRQNELISAAYGVMEKLVIDGLAQKYFYIRYADPEHHLRLRIQPTEKGLATLFSNISGWLGNLYTDGLISKAVNDSYFRETERYGGSELIEYAEDYFYNDSKLTMNLITKQRYGDLHLTMDYIGISFVISVLESFGLSIEEQEILLNSMGDKSAYKKEFQNNRKMIMSACDSSDEWFDIRSSILNPEVYDLINDNSLELRKYANVIYYFDRRGELTNSIREIVLSVIHMFCNRLMGNNAWERKIYALARHGVHNLRGFLQYQNKIFKLELPESLI